MRTKNYLIFLLLIGVLSIVLAGCTKSEPQPISGTQNQNAQNPHMFQTTVTPEKVGPPTVLPKDKKPEQWVKEYYELYAKGDFEKAYSYLPAINKARETTESFKSSRKQMPISSFEIGTPTETKEGTATLIKVPVNLSSGGMAFQTTWVFEKRQDGSFIAKETQTAINSSK
ncbi:MAG: hypothetical protein N2440_05670 [Actinobacteria bacterium]|nr:hypothetical protein [Actinomycetota bacterium]